jgi:3-phosphoglycerate kinase
VDRFGPAQKNRSVSNAGGAMLEYLEVKVLPGIAVVKV